MKSASLMMWLSGVNAPASLAVIAAIALGATGCDIVGNPLQEYTIEERGAPPPPSTVALPAGKGGPLLASGQYRGWVAYKTISNTCPASYSGPAEGWIFVDLTDDEGALRMRVEGGSGSYPEMTGAVTGAEASVQGLQVFPYKGETVECRAKGAVTASPKAAAVRVSEEMSSPSQLNCVNSVEFSIPRPM